MEDLPWPASKNKKLGYTEFICDEKRVRSKRFLICSDNRFANSRSSAFGIPTVCWWKLSTAKARGKDLLPGTLRNPNLLKRFYSGSCTERRKTISSHNWTNSFGDIFHVFLHLDGSQTFPIFQSKLYVDVRRKSCVSTLSGLPRKAMRSTYEMTLALIVFSGMKIISSFDKIQDYNPLQISFDYQQWNFGDRMDTIVA